MSLTDVPSLCEATSTVERGTSEVSAMSTDRKARQKKGRATATAPDLTPPPVVLYHLATGHYISRALFLAAKLGIADLLKNGPRQYGDLAVATGTHAPSLNRVMRLLVSAGVFAEGEDGNFSLTAVGECLQTGVPGSSRAMVGLFAGDRIQDSWKDLEYCVRTGDPEFRRRGVTNIFQDPRRTPENESNFDAAMADITRLTAIAVTAVYDFAGFRTLIDVGGGNGTLLVGYQSGALDRCLRDILTMNQSVTNSSL
jgi:O-methyltransferase domain/Dimerisation domain